MNYFSSPGQKQHYNDRTVKEPLPVVARVRDLRANDVFIVSGFKYKVVKRTGKIYYKLFWGSKMTGPLQFMSAASMERIQIVDNVPYQNPGVKSRSGIKLTRNWYQSEARRKSVVVSLINQ